MRLLCSFQVSQLPIAYRMGLVSLIKESLRLSDEAYYRRLYESGQQSKPFAFAPFLKNFKLDGDVYRLEECQMTISSPDHEFLLHVYNGMQRKNHFGYKQFSFQRKQIRLIPERPIREPKVVFRTLSPILVENKEGRPLSPDSPDYESELQYLADTILRSYRGTGLQEPLQFKPLQMTKTVIKEQNHDFAERFGEGKYLFFTAFKGRFQLQGHPDDLQALYQLGLSKRRNQGFGLLEVD